MTQLINIFGGPGIGKSTTAAGLYSLMKLRNKSVELVLEQHKLDVYNLGAKAVENQLWITACQERAIQKVWGKVDWIVTDTPLLLGLAYSTDPGLFSALRTLAIHLHEYYGGTNILLTRAKEYKPEGRLQTEGEAKELDHGVKFLFNYYCPLGTRAIVPGDSHAPRAIYDIIFKS